jgi:hypothetical protein
MLYFHVFSYEDTKYPIHTVTAATDHRSKKYDDIALEMMYVKSAILFYSDIFSKNRV